MATFEVQIEAMTSLDIGASTIPSQAQITEFLKEGVLDVTNRTTTVAPHMIQKFQRESSTSDSQGVDVNGAKIIGVIREINADGSSDGSVNWAECRFSLPHLQSRLVDKESLHYASIYNPAYLVDGAGVVNVYPVPSANNGFKVFYVNNEPKGDGTSDSLAYGHSTIGYFPDELEYLVVIYASIKVLEHAMANWSQEEEDIEMTQATSLHIGSLKKEYLDAFTYIAAGSGAMMRQGEETDEN